MPFFYCGNFFCRDGQLKDDGFYLRATGTSFTKQKVGIHTLEKMVPTMMKEAGFHGRFTLHSLRATCASRLFHRGVDEQLICSITGHKSNVLVCYIKSRNR